MTRALQGNGESERRSLLLHPSCKCTDCGATSPAYLCCRFKLASAPGWCDFIWHHAGIVRFHRLRHQQASSARDPPAAVKTGIAGGKKMRVVSFGRLHKTSRWRRKSTEQTRTEKRWEVGQAGVCVENATERSAAADWSRFFSKHQNGELC